MEAGSSAVDGSAAAKSGQQMTNEKEEDKEKCESGGEQTRKEKEEKGSGMVTWCTGVAGMGLFLTVVKNIISGVTDVMVKTTFDGINPITLVFLRSILMISLIMPASIVKDEGPFPAGQSIMDRFLLVVQCGIGGGKLIVTWFAIHQMPLGVSKMILGSKPVFAIVFARIFLGEKIHRLDFFAVVLMIGGVVIAIKPWEEFAPEDGFNQQFLLATILLFVATALHSNVAIIFRKFKEKSALSLMASKDFSYMMITGCLLIGLGLDLPALPWIQRLHLLLLSIFSISVSALNIFSLKVEEAGRVTLVDRSSSIVIGFVTQSVVFGQIPTPMTWVGVCLVLASTIIIGAGRLWAARVRKMAEKGSSLAIIAKAKNEAFSQVYNLNLEIVAISYSV